VDGAHGAARPLAIASAIFFCAFAQISSRAEMAPMRSRAAAMVILRSKVEASYAHCVVRVAHHVHRTNAKAGQGNAEEDQRSTRRTPIRQGVSIVPCWELIRLDYCRISEATPVHRMKMGIGFLCDFASLALRLLTSPRRILVSFAVDAPLLSSRSMKRRCLLLAVALVSAPALAQEHEQTAGAPARPVAARGPSISRAA